MIKISKDYDNVPKALTRIGCKRKIKRAIEAQSGKGYDGYYYKDSSVKEKLKEIYKDKCAYCESKIGHAASLQVEHYRPKNGLAEDTSHNGYYWLGCEWSNLLLACPKCNGKGAKGTKFPITGTRVSDDTAFTDITNLETFDRVRLKADCSVLLAEEPLLLNPELDNPTEHLTFDKDGQIKGKTARGEETINICNLKRESLFIYRKTFSDKILKDIENICLKRLLMPYTTEIFYDRLKEKFEELKERKSALEEYTLWGHYCFNYFEICFVQKLNIKYQNDVRLAFEAYKKNEL